MSFQFFSFIIQVKKVINKSKETKTTNIIISKHLEILGVMWSVDARAIVIRRPSAVDA